MGLMSRTAGGDELAFRGALGNDVLDDEPGGVGGEDAGRLADLVQRFEHRLLQLKLLRDGLDDEVAVGEVVGVGSGLSRTRARERESA